MEEMHVTWVRPRNRPFLFSRLQRRNISDSASLRRIIDWTLETILTAAIYSSQNVRIALR